MTDWEAKARGTEVDSPRPQLASGRAGAHTQKAWLPLYLRADPRIQGRVDAGDHLQT